MCIDGHDIFFHLFAVVNLRIVMSVPVPPPLHCTERGGEERRRGGEEERRRGEQSSHVQLISHLTLLSPLTFTMHSTRQYQLEFSLTKSVGLIHVTCMYTRTCSIVYMYMYVHDRSATTTALRTAYDGIEFTQWKDAIRQISHLITYSTCTCHVHTCVMCHVHTCERSVLWLAVGAVVAVYVSCLVLLHTNTAADRGGGGGRGWMGMGKE